MIANRQGDIAKQLTIIATIFLPLDRPDRLLRPELRVSDLHPQNTTWLLFVLGLGLLLAADRRIPVLLRRRRGWFCSTQ